MGRVQELLRAIPKVDEMLRDERLVFLSEKTSHNVVAEALRGILDETRKEILAGNTEAVPDREKIISAVTEKLTERPMYHFRRLINATGVVLHTNLGRAVLSDRAIEAVREAGSRYSNLEYDVEQGCRGSRHDHVEEILRRLTGAEAAMIVNNNAAAVMLMLASLAAGREVVVSRGEEVEIGGAFRIPDIMSQSGAVLREVGTTNRTKPEDYENAYQEGVTGAFLKVHTSNYRILGFTRETTLQELSELRKKCPVPVLYDMGSGLFLNLSRYGIDEPDVSAMLKAGADLVTFSGDKLLGGPQAGIIVGRKEYIDKIKKHPLARAFRVDKMTLAAAEATLYAYLDPKQAFQEIPTLRMIAASEDTLHANADRLQLLLKEKLGPDSGWKFGTEPCDDRTGGGSSPLAVLRGYAVTLEHRDMTADAIEKKLRGAKVPVIARTAQEEVLLSMRTVQEDEYGLIAEALRS